MRDIRRAVASWRRRLRLTFDRWARMTWVKAIHERAGLRLRWALLAAVALASFVVLNVVLFAGVADGLSGVGKAWFVAALLFIGAATAVAMHRVISWRGLHSRIWVLGVLVIYVLVLAAAGMWNCADGQVPLWSQLYQGLLMLTGEPNLDACSPLPLTAEVAHYAGIGVLAAAAVSVVLTVTSTQVDKVRAHRSRRLILVTGLEPDSLPVIRALLEDSEGCLVVVAEPDPEHDLLPLIRNLGGVVLHYPFGSGPMDRVRLKRLLTYHGDKVALQRAYLLSSDDRQNLARAEELRAILRDLPEVADYLPPPRIIVRVDRYRQARHYLTEQLRDWGSGKVVRAFISVIGRHQLTAQMLAQRITERGQPDHVIVVGKTDLAEAFCDEYAIQQASARMMRDRLDYREKSPLPDDTAQKRAMRMLGFQRTKASLPPPRRVEQIPNYHELRALQATYRRTSVVVTTELDEATLFQLETDAMRLDGEKLRIFVLDPETAGLTTYPMLGTLHPFGLSLGGRRGSADDHADRDLHTSDPLTGVPPDSWSRAARLIADLYGVESGPNAWQQENAENRESNIRGLRHLLAYWTGEGFDWVAKPGCDPEPAPEVVLEAFVSVEHENWLHFKRHHDWIGTLSETDKARKENKFLFDWAEMPADRVEKARVSTKMNAELVLGALAVLGFHPVPRSSASAEPDGSAETPSPPVRH